MASKAFHWPPSWPRAWTSGSPKARPLSRNRHEGVVERAPPVNRHLSKPNEAMDASQQPGQFRETRPAASARGPKCRTHRSDIPTASRGSARERHSSAHSYSACRQPATTDSKRWRPQAASVREPATDDHELAPRNKPHTELADDAGRIYADPHPNTHQGELPRGLPLTTMRRSRNGSTRT